MNHRMIEEFYSRMTKAVRGGGAQGANDLILIDGPKRGKKKKTNLAMCWIDYRKVYDIVTCSYIMECLTMFKIAENLSKFHSMLYLSGKLN